MFVNKCKKAQRDRMTPVQNEHMDIGNTSKGELNHVRCEQTCL